MTHVKNSRRLRHFLIALPAAALVAACGGGSDADPTAPLSRSAPQAPLAAQVPTATQLMDWAETNYPQLFPGRQANLTSAPYVYRFYPSTGNYLGVDANDVYLLGPVAGGSAPVRVGTLPDFACRVFPDSCAPAPTPTPTPAPTPAPASPSAARGSVLWTQTQGTQFACMDCHGSTPRANFSQIWNASGTASSQGDPSAIVRGIQANSGGAMGLYASVSSADLADIAAYINATRYGKPL